MKQNFIKLLFLLSILFFYNRNALALSDGEAVGTFTIDGKSTAIKHAFYVEEENLFDSNKKDKIVSLTDIKIEDSDPTDKIDVSLRARKGELVALIARFDNMKVVNVALYYNGVNGEILLPGNWFTATLNSDNSGSLKLDQKEWDGHKYSCDLKFQIKKYLPIKTEEVITTSETTTSTTLPKASTSFIDNKVLTEMLIAEIMKKDEEQAVKVINIGIDPNSKDKYGTPILNWAVMTCLPKVVKRIVDKGADLKYERAPGLTIITEAGACPAAEKILREAGAK